VHYCTTTLVSLLGVFRSALVRVGGGAGCGFAPVVENTKELKLVGVVTERDVCCVAADDRRASDVRIEEIMRPSSPVMAQMSRLKTRAENSTSIARRPCPL
jgi:CBS domain-containing protein